MQHIPNCHCDQCLLLHMRSGDPNVCQRGWETWYARDHQKLAIYVRRHCQTMGCIEQSEDVLQDTFIAGFKNITSGRYEDRGKSLCAYLYGIARNLLADTRRLQRKETLDEEFLEQQVSDDLSLDDRVYLERILQLIREAISNLSEIYRQVLDRLYVDEMLSQDVGQELHKSAMNIRTIARRAIQSICIYLERHYKVSIPADAIRLSLGMIYTGDAV